MDSNKMTGWILIATAVLFVFTGFSFFGEKKEDESKKSQSQASSVKEGKKIFKDENRPLSKTVDEESQAEEEKIKAEMQKLNADLQSVKTVQGLEWVKEVKPVTVPPSAPVKPAFNPKATQYKPPAALKPVVQTKTSTATAGIPPKIYNASQTAKLAKTTTTAIHTVSLAKPEPAKTQKE